MRSLFFILLTASFLMIGCDLQQVKDAAADINQAANKASTATSEEVHAIRAMEITHNNITFTVNDLYKQVLRDVFWDYEADEKGEYLTIKGTWQPTLFEDYGLNLTAYPKLNVDGEVLIQLTIRDEMIVENETKISVQLADEILLEESGTLILTDLYETYTK